jgi:hypothetical protein
VVLVAMRDVTETRRVEQLKSDFISTVSHELRTPLTSIIGYSELLRRPGRPPAAKESSEVAARIHEKAIELQRLVEQLLEAASIRAGAVELSIVRTDIGALVDEVLWGYARFCTWLPNLSPEMAPPDEPRQNHTTFLALSLFNSYRYFTGKYGITGLDSLAESARMAFDRGAASSFRPNDDAGSYLNLAPIHLLTYQLGHNDLSYVKSPKMAALADLVAATIDNRNDPVGFGDVGGYTHRVKGTARGTDASFFGMTAWATGDPRYQWLYNWSTGTGPDRGGELGFSLEEMYYGCYAVDGKEAFPAHLTGVHPVFLDEGALKWSALRSWKNGIRLQLPVRKLSVLR